MNKKINPCGNSMRELSTEELVNIYGADTATPISTIPCSVARVLGLKNNRVFLTIILPSCVPYIFTGLQVSLSTSWMAVLAAEMITATSGCGWLILAGMQSGIMLNNVLGMIAIGFIGLALAILMRIIERRLCSWRERN